MEPVGFRVRQYAVPLLQKQNVGGHFGACRRFECGIRQPHRADQVAAGGQVPAHILAFLVHRPACGDDGLDTAHAQLVDILCRKVIVDQEIVAVEGRVVYFVLPKRHIAHHRVKKAVRQRRLFIARDLDVCFRKKLLGDAPRDRVQFHAVQHRAVRIEGRRAVGEECAHAHARFQDVAALQAEALQRFIHGADDLRRRIERGQGRGAGGFIFLCGQQFLQRFIFPCPLGFFAVEGVGQAAPAHITGQHLLLFRAGLLAVGIQILQQPQSSDIVLEPGLGAARRLTVTGGAVIDRILAAFFDPFLICGVFRFLHGLELRPFAIHRDFHGIVRRAFLGRRCGLRLLYDFLRRFILLQFLFQTPLYIFQIVHICGLCRGQDTAVLHALHISIMQAGDVLQIGTHISGQRRGQ